MIPLLCGDSLERELMKRVLVIEDDKDIVELVRYNLERTVTR
jgi:CheY-like chemotaxis protein